MRTVKTKSIPNVPDERLTGDIVILHNGWHDVLGSGLREGSLNDARCNGRIIKAIAAEIQRRGILHPLPGCTFCAANE